jgi:hypothetical protein
LPHNTASLICIAVGLLMVLRTDSIVVAMEKRMQMSAAAKVDMRWRNARVVFRVVGCVFVSVGAWEFFH